MEHETPAARIIQRIAAELGVPVASFYEQGGSSPADSEAMQKAVAALLNAFVSVREPEERRHALAILDAEAERLRDAPDGGEQT